MKKIIVSLFITAFLFSGCASITTIKAKIKAPDRKEYVYQGPKDVDMSIKKGDVEVKYSGKKEGFWSSMLKYLLMKPNIEVRNK